MPFIKNSKEMLTMIQAKMHINENFTRQWKSHKETEDMMARYDRECGPVTVYNVRDLSKSQKELA